MPKTHINHITLYYEQHGIGDDLILIGGLSADHQVWKSTIRHLSHHFRILIFDNRGAGQTSSPDYPYTTEMMAHDVLQLMDALHISKAHVVGHSMGGCVAQQMMLLAPDRIKKCVIACSRAKPNALGNMVLSLREKLEAAGISKELLAEYVMPFLFSEDFLKQDFQVKGFIQWTLQNENPQTPAGFKNQLQAVKNHNVVDQLSKIEKPVLIIAGENDILMPVKQAKEMSDLIKNSIFKIIDNCAHMPHVENSKAFSELVLAFLKK